MSDNLEVNQSYDADSDPLAKYSPPPFTFPSLSSFSSSTASQPSTVGSAPIDAAADDPLQLNALHMQLSSLQLDNEKLRAENETLRREKQVWQADKKKLEELQASAAHTGSATKSAGNYEKLLSDYEKLLVSWNDTQRLLKEEQEKCKLLMKDASAATSAPSTSTATDPALILLSQQNEALAAHNAQLAVQIQKQQETQAQEAQSASLSQARGYAARISQLEDSLESQRDSHEVELNILRKEILQMRTHAHMVKSSSNEAPLPPSEQVQHSQAADLMALQRRTNELQQAVNSKSLELMEIETQIEARREVLRATTLNMEQPDQTPVSDSNADHKLDASQSQIAEFIEQLTQAHSALRACQNELLLAANQAENMRSERDALMRQLSVYETHADKREIHREISDMEKQLISSLESERVKLKAEVAHESNTMQALHKQIEMAHLQLKELEKRKLKLSSEVAQKESINRLQQPLNRQPISPLHPPRGSHSPSPHSVSRSATPSSPPVSSSATSSSAVAGTASPAGRRTPVQRQVRLPGVSVVDERLNAERMRSESPPSGSTPGGSVPPHIREKDREAAFQDAALLAQIKASTDVLAALKTDMTTGQQQLQSLEKQIALSESQLQQLKDAHEQTRALGLQIGAELTSQIEAKQQQLNEVAQQLQAKQQELALVQQEVTRLNLSARASPTGGLDIPLSPIEPTNESKVAMNATVTGEPVMPKLQVSTSSGSSSPLIRPSHSRVPSFAAATRSSASRTEELVRNRERILMNEIEEATIAKQIHTGPGSPSHRRNKSATPSARGSRTFDFTSNDISIHPITGQPRTKSPHHSRAPSTASMSSPTSPKYGHISSKISAIWSPNSSATEADLAEAVALASAEKETFQQAKSHYAHVLKGLQKEIQRAQIHKRAMASELTAFQESCEREKAELLKQMEEQRKLASDDRGTAQRIARYRRTMSVGSDVSMISGTSEASHRSPRSPGRSPPTSPHVRALNSILKEQELAAENKRLLEADKLQLETDKETLTAEKGLLVRAVQDLQTELHIQLQAAQKQQQELTEQSDALKETIRDDEQRQLELHENIDRLDAKWKVIQEKVASVYAPIVTLTERPKSSPTNREAEQVNKQTDEKDDNSIDDDVITGENESAPLTPLETAQLRHRVRELTRLNTELLNQVQMQNTAKADFNFEPFTLNDESAREDAKQSAQSLMLPKSAFLVLQDYYQAKEVAYQSTLQSMRVEMSKIKQEHLALVQDMQQALDSKLEIRLSQVETTLKSFVEQAREAAAAGNSHVSSTSLYEELLTLVDGLQGLNRMVSMHVSNFEKQLLQLRHVRMNLFVQTNVDQAIAERDSYILYLVAILRGKGFEFVCQFLPPLQQIGGIMKNPALLLHSSKKAPLALMAGERDGFDSTELLDEKQSSPQSVQANGQRLLMSASYAAIQSAAKSAPIVPASPSTFSSLEASRKHQPPSVTPLRAATMSSDTKEKLEALRRAMLSGPIVMEVKATPLKSAPEEVAPSTDELIEAPLEIARPMSSPSSVGTRSFASPSVSRPHWSDALRTTPLTMNLYNHPNTPQRSPPPAPASSPVAGARPTFPTSRTPAGIPIGPRTSPTLNTGAARLTFNQSRVDQHALSMKESLQRGLQQSKLGKLNFE